MKSICVLLCVLFFRRNRCHDIYWIANHALFEFTVFNKQVIKFDKLSELSNSIELN